MAPKKKAPKEQFYDVNLNKKASEVLMEILTKVLGRKPVGEVRDDCRHTTVEDGDMIFILELRRVSHIRTANMRSIAVADNVMGTFKQRAVFTPDLRISITRLKLIVKRLDSILPSLHKKFDDLANIKRAEEEVRTRQHEAFMALAKTLKHDKRSWLHTAYQGGYQLTIALADENVAAAISVVNSFFDGVEIAEKLKVAAALHEVTPSAIEKALDAAKREGIALLEPTDLKGLPIPEGKGGDTSEGQEISVAQDNGSPAGSRGADAGSVQ